MAEKTAQEVKDAERAKINSTTEETINLDPEKEKEETKTSEENTEETKEEVEAKEEQLEETEEKIEALEETEKELEEKIANAKTEKERERFEKRLNKEVSKRKVLETENAQLKAQLAAKDAEGGDKFTSEDVKKEAQRIANEQTATNEFNKACEKLAKDASKIDKDFNTKVIAMSDDIGKIPGEMIGMLEDLDNGGAVLSYLTNNIDEAEEIFGLTSARMALRLTRLSEKIKPKVKATSKVPPVNTPLGPNGRTTATQLHDKMSDKEWIEKRNADVAAKRANGRIGLR